MALSIQSVVRRLRIANIAHYSTAAKTIPISEEPQEFFRTLQNDPSKHTEKHLYRYYTIPQEHDQILFKFGGITKNFRMQADTFGENCIMVRKPAIEIMSYLKQADYSKPVNKYILCKQLDGEFGSGKSSTLLHLLHYGYMTNKLIIHIYWVLHWFKYPKEFAPSTTITNCWNLPLDSANWLMHFKTQNHKLLENPDLKISKTYEWGPNETTLSGAPILELLELGITRVKYASDIMIALMDEIKNLSNAGICDTLCVIDGFNGLFTDYTRIKNDRHKFVPAENITLTHALLKITESNWRNGAVILTVDQNAHYERKESIYPHYLLSHKGFEHLDPFIPVLVDNYNEEEFQSNIEYFKNRKWIRDISPLGLLELQAICKSNPKRIREYCNSL